MECACIAYFLLCCARFHSIPFIHDLIGMASSSFFITLLLYSNLSICLDGSMLHIHLSSYYYLYIVGPSRHGWIHTIPTTLSQPACRIEFDSILVWHARCPFFFTHCCSITTKKLIETSILFRCIDPLFLLFHKSYILVV